MKTKTSHPNQELMTAILASILALGVLIGAWMGVSVTTLPAITFQDAAIALILVLAIVATHKYPIHIRPHTKIHMNSVPLYLCAVLLPVPIAVWVIALGTLTGQQLVRKERGSLLTDVAISTSRWVIVGFLATLVAHVSVADKLGESLVLLGTALVFFVGDMLSVSFQVSQISGESPQRALVANLREAGIAEVVQYLIGILGVLAAFTGIWSLILLAVPIVIVYMAFKSTKETRDGTRRLLEAMADAVDLRDPYTGGHSRRVADLMKGTLKELSIVGVEAELIRMAARLHDIGKVGIPDAVLKKEGSLTPEEWEIMKSHPERGAELLSRYPDFSRGADFVRYHHERWDGQGYPRALKGLDIPLGARVIAVVDGFDAMTSDRPYRRALSVEQAIQILWAGRGKQWDPTAVDSMLRVIAKQLERPELAQETLVADFAPVAE